MNLGDPLPDSVLAAALLEDLLADAPVGLGLVDTRLRYVRVNRALAQINGIAAEDHAGRPVIEVLPALAEPLEQLLREVLEGEPLFDRPLHAALEGDRAKARSFRVTAIPVRDAGEVVAGVGVLLVETTDTRATQTALKLAEERLHVMLEGTATGTFEYDIATNTVRWSDNLGPLWGHERGWHPDTYEDFIATVHPEDRPGLEAMVRAAVADGKGYDRDFRHTLPGGQVRWAHTKVHVIEEGGRPATLIGLVVDATERRRREDRTRFLARASLSLAESLDMRATLGHLAELAVPTLADWSSVVLLGDDGLETIAVHHSDPAKVSFARDLAERYPTDPDSATGAPAVIRTGRSEIYPVIERELLQASAADAEHLRLLEALDLRSAMVVPIVARGRRLGAITFVYAESGREYTTDDLDLAEELGRRAGIALDNAVLHESVRTMATTLQRSLLPEIPVIAGLDIAAHYGPGQAGAEVGGDWYDVFMLPDGRCAIAVGDVVGRGIPAAAKMGQLRAATRAYAVHAPGPAHVLDELDGFVGHLGAISFATLVLGFLDLATGELELASAGHPPALLVPARGAPAQVPLNGGLPLGVGDPGRTGSRLNLGATDALVLYSDGLVERRDITLDERLEALARALEGAQGRSAEALTGAALEGMLTGDDPHRDDVVVLSIVRS